MELVTGATSSLLPKLGALLQDEYQLQDKVRKDIESLQNELMFMNATLRMVAEVPPDQLDEHVRIWAVFIKEVSYDMEDTMSTFLARVHSAPHLDGLITKFFNMFCLGRTHHQIASMVEEIKNLIKEVGDLRERYRFDNIISRAVTSVVLPQRDNTLARYHADRPYGEFASWYINHEKPVGLEQEIEWLRSWITSDDEETIMMCITGPPGVGKTTIAMALYQDYWAQFQLRAMVNVSRDSVDPKTALMDILSQIKPRELQCHDGDINEIRAELKESLQGRRFLVLLDDVRSAVLLDQIRRSLPHTVPGSKIIVTTRYSHVVFKMGTESLCHEVRSRNVKDSAQLFTEVSGEEDHKKIPPELWEICHGRPLAIIIMARQFACNPWKSKEEWIEVSKALRPDLGFTDYNLKSILSTCYNDMPVEIKTCSLYFSIFPWGQTISRNRLTRRWISDGFIIEREGFTAEEVAETYLNHLIRRKFLRATEHSRNGKVKSYQVINEKVLEYIVSKANEDNFVTAVGGWVMLPSSRKIRRLSINCSGSEYGKELEIMNMSHVRDLTMFGSVKQLPSSSFKFGVVQILDLEGCKDFKQQHTKGIYRMLLLKYLSLRGTGIKKLTKRVGDLQYLETLDIRETDVIELPKEICKLERVVNIFGGNKRTRKALKLPRELGKKKKMEALRTLTGIEISEETTANLHHLTNLRKLAIYKLNINEGWLFEKLSSSIEQLEGCSLCTLVIHDESCEFFRSLDDHSVHPKLLNALELSGKLVELPKWIASMSYLSELTLPVTALRTDNLQLLSKMRLDSLTFSLTAAKQDQQTAAIIEGNKACSDGVISFPATGFLSLKLLLLSAPYVPQLSFQRHLQSLRRLDLQFSNFEGIVGIRNLREVHIKVHDRASETTKSIVKEMVTAARKDREGPTIILA